ncbi:TNF receptor-associated factor 6 [Bienertia sinuspersici]
MVDVDACFTEVDLKQEKFEDVKEEGKKYSCDLCDKEMVHKMALVLLEGLSTACVDNTTGDIFKSPGTVAADIRKEMLDYLKERTESFVAETFLSEEGPEEGKPDQPSDIISDIIEDFTVLKRNILSRVSGWLLSDMREDKIDDFVQEMELNSFWLLDRRETIAKTLLKNVDYKNEFHCNMKFKSEEEVELHRPKCGFRTVMCENEGCCATFSAAQLEHHDSICLFKMLPCEQKCPEILMRREMDRHCITVCPMKLVNCPFYSIGCQATVPSCNMKEHCLDDVRSHLRYALQYLHKDALAEDLAPRADQIERESFGRLAGTQSVRSFTNIVKDLDSKLGPIEIVKDHVDDDKDTKRSNSENPPSEDKTKLDSEQTLTEDTKKSSPAEDEKKSDSEQPPTEDKRKSDLKQPSLKGSKTDDHSAEEVRKSDTDYITIENMKKSEFELRQPPKDPKTDDHSAHEQPKSDTEHNTVEKMNSESELSMAPEDLKTDDHSAEESPKSDTEHNTVEKMKNSESELSMAPEDLKTDDHSAEESPKSDTEHNTVESMKKSEFESAPNEEVKKFDAKQPFAEDMSEISL